MAQPRMINLDEQAKVLSLTNPIIAPLAVTQDKMAVDSIATVNIIDLSVTYAKLDPLLIGQGLIGNNITSQIDINVDNSTLQVSGGFLRVKPSGITVNELNINADLDINLHQLLHMRLENLGANPAPGNPGRLIWRTDRNVINVDTGTGWLQATLQIHDHGNVIPQEPVVNFVGAGVQITDLAGVTQVSIPGSNPIYIRETFEVPVSLDYTYPLANDLDANSEIVTLNGMVLVPGVGEDYIVVGNSIVIDPGITLTVGDTISVFYAATQITSPIAFAHEIFPILIAGPTSIFTLTNTPSGGNSIVTLNGLVLRPGIGFDYTISSNIVTVTYPVLVGDSVMVSYAYLV